MVGNWSGGYPIRINFKIDGTFEMYKVRVYFTGTYKVSGNQIKLTYQGFSTIESDRSGSQTDHLGKTSPVFP